MKTKGTNWEPVLKGDIYCSPACGHGCTKAEHKEAVKKAGALAKLLGNGWKKRVWENMGWHYSASKGKMSVSPSSDGSYWVSLHTVPSFTLYHKDPKRGVLSIIKALDDHIANLKKQRALLK